MSSVHNYFADKVIDDILRAISSDQSLDLFELISTPSNENKNLSPVHRGDRTLGLESWALRHVLPHAHRQILDPLLKKDYDKIIRYLWAVNLLNPDMATAWGRRKEYIQRRKLPPKDELRLTRMALSFKPKCNEALMHRRWLISQHLIPGDSISILHRELEVVNLIADRYHSNYHAWTHRQWAMQTLAPFQITKDLGSSVLLAEFSKINLYNLYASSSFTLYLSEIETNFNFITSHVSDHSGLHYRKFLLSQIFLLFRNNAIQPRQTTSIAGQNGKEALLLYIRLKTNVKSFVGEVTNQVLIDYLLRVEKRLTIFDAIISILINELNSNFSVSKVFDNHEALWTFRRFLVHTFHSICQEVKAVYRSSTIIYSDFSNSGVLGEKRESEAIDLLLERLFHNEECAMNHLKKCEALNSYSKWLKRLMD